MVSNLVPTPLFPFGSDSFSDSLNVLLCHLMKGSQPFTMASLLCSAISFVLSLLFVVVIGNPVDFKIERVVRNIAFRFSY